MTTMTTRLSQPADLPAMQAFLQAMHLPTAGLRDAPRSGYLLVEEAGSLVGLAGLEVHGPVGLLRSVAVEPRFRSQGVAAHLVTQAIGYARQFHLTDLYLLTTTAAAYFPRFGFTPLPRAQAPAALQASAEFQGACPESATLMYLPLETPMTRTARPDIHRTAPFLAALRDAPALPLEFRLDGEPLVPAGYHVTEVKAVSIESMDCGGQANAWRETVIQLMDGTPDEARRGFMTTQKFLGIYDRVAARVPIQADSDVRVEYGNVTTPALQFHVHAVEVGSDSVTVDLRRPGVMCKASGASSSAGQCCGPSEPAQVMPAAPQGTAGACCPPANADLVPLA